MRLIKIRELIKIIKEDGWQKSEQTGSHLQYHHPKKKGKVTISAHRLGNTVPIGTQIKILKQAGII